MSSEPSGGPTPASIPSASSAARAGDDAPVRARDDAPAIQVRTRGMVGPAVWVLVAALVSFVAVAVIGKEAPPPLAVQLPIWLLPALAVVLSLGAKVRVGADGISVGHALRRVFVPATDVRDVQRVYMGPTPTSRETWKLVVGRRSTREPLSLPLIGVPVDRVDAIEARIRRLVAFTAQRRTEVLTALHRGERDVDAWRRDMGALLAGGGFRTAALSAEDLHEVLEDPAASGEQKLGAALALRGAGGAADRERVRVAAVASARPKLRVALERVALEPVAEERVAEAVAQEEVAQEEAIAEALAESEAEQGEHVRA